MKETELEQTIAQTITPAIEARGLDLVCIKRTGEILQIMVENPETRNLGLDECAVLSREISALLDVDDLISDAYRLEVSSPGIDRPLIKLQDFQAFKGQEAKIELEDLFEGQKRFRGVLTGIEGDNILINTDQGEVALPYKSVHKAKLVLTDALIAQERARN